MNIKAKIIHVLKHNEIVQAMYRGIMSTGFRVLGFFIKTDPKVVLMNGHGGRFNDSPKAIFQKMLELGMDKQYDIVWAVNDVNSVDLPGCRVIKMDTPQYFLTALKAKYWISCVNIERGLHFKKKDQVYLNTWHGAAINLCGNGVSGRHDFNWDYIDYFCSCSDFETPFLVKDFGVREDAVVCTGYPRNDELYASNDTIRTEMRKKLGIPEGKKVILYAPTWRESKDGGATYKLIPPIDWAKWEKELGDDYIVLLRTHAYTTKLMNVEFNDFVRNFCEYPSVNHLLIAADILISDYSSIQLDYCVLEKPLICFGYDFDEYNAERGFYYDLDTTMPGGLERTEDEVLERIKTMDYDAECEEVREFKKVHMQYGGTSSVECINLVFGTEYKA